jgi:hypothetical protein
MYLGRSYAVALSASITNKPLCVLDTLVNGRNDDTSFFLARPAHARPRFDAKAKARWLGAIHHRDAPSFSKPFAHAYAHTGRRHVHRTQPEPKQAPESTTKCSSSRASRWCRPEHTAGREDHFLKRKALHGEWAG